MLQFIKKLLLKIMHLARREKLAFIAALFLIWLVSTFSEFIDDVIEGDSQALDRQIFTALRDPNDISQTLGPGWFAEMMRDITGLGGIAVLTLISAASILYLLILGKKRQALYVLCAVSLGTVLTNILKAGFARPRPDLVPYESVVYTASLPSGHSMMAAVVYLTLGLLLAEAQPNLRLRLFIVCVCALVAFFVGISRIYLGMHWPSDVAAGWMGGAAWALMCWTVERFLRLTRKDQNGN